MVGRRTSKLVPVESNRAMLRAQQTHDGFEQRRFTDAVAPHQTYDLPRLHVQINAT
jgi:hypothetical protein